jgi:hypothetical protein
MPRVRAIFPDQRRDQLRDQHRSPSDPTFDDPPLSCNVSLGNLLLAQPQQKPQDNPTHRPQKPKNHSQTTFSPNFIIQKSQRRSTLQPFPHPSRHQVFFQFNKIPRTIDLLTPGKVHSKFASEILWKLSSSTADADPRIPKLDLKKILLSESGVFVHQKNARFMRNKEHDIDLKEYQIIGKEIGDLERVVGGFESNLYGSEYWKAITSYYEEGGGEGEGVG